MFFLIDFSYKQELGIHTRLLPPVIPAQAGIQTLAFKEYLGMLQFQTSRFPPARE